MRNLAPLLAYLALLLCPASGRAFDLEAYRQFLETVENQTAAELIESHEPFGPYTFDVPAFPAAPEFLDPIIDRYDLTEGELGLIEQHGFMVTERLSFESFGHVFSTVWHADLPVFVSTDAILHALHRSYVDILGGVETYHLAVTLHEALGYMHDAWLTLETRYGDDPGMRASVDDVDVYLAVARSLLVGYTVQAKGDNQAVVDELLQLCYAEQPAEYPLFNETPRLYDFSQMKPRGHYTESETLRGYFRAMMWLGRTELRLTPPEGTIPQVGSVTREILDAFLIREVASLGAGDLLEEIDTLIRALVGPPDNVTFDELDLLAEAIDLESPDELLDPLVEEALQEEVASGAYTAQAINSQILTADPMDPDAVRPPFAFLVFGQRFILDSFIAENVVYDSIRYEGQTPFRGLPHPFDVLFALGNDDVLPLLQDELEQYHHAANLSALRYLIDGYEPGYWRESLYATWLHAIRTLSGSGKAAGVPDFMRTGAWQQEKMNTQLASWTELRHDNLLYAKQSYTDGPVCSFPRTYVEPVPEFYETLEVFAADAAMAFSGIPSSVPLAGRIGPFFERMGTIMSDLGTIAEKELAGEPYTPAEIDFLASVLFFDGDCGSDEYGWYRDLFFVSSATPTTEEDLLIADVHTQPADEFGAPVGKVMHVATGSPELGVFVAAPPGQPLTAFVGPVASFHEYVTTNFLRLSDEEWEDIYDAEPPTRPDWTYVYLADENGEVRDGPRLVDGPTPAFPDENPSAPALPGLRLAQNRPNPFNPSTVIGFRLDTATSGAVTLRVYDVSGALIATLVDEPLRPGAYYTRWDGRDTGGREVGSGSYVAELRAGDVVRTRKMTLVR